MSPNLRLLISQSHNAHFNLAVEECIFKAMDPSQQVLFLWRNEKVVVIGRAQNPWKECNTRMMEQDNVQLARRQSGGGAVYQDLGNSCFTFMAGKPGYHKDISTTIVLNALHHLGIKAEASGRNDLIVPMGDEVRKISGSAYKESADRGFHHGTLLRNTNLADLARYLNPDPKKLEAKGITSVISRVTNLITLDPNLTYEKIDDALIQSFFAYYHAQVTPEYISPNNLPNLAGFEAQFAKQQSWEWNYGAVLAFTHKLNTRFPWGGIDLLFEVDNGLITKAQLYSDSLILDPLDALAEQLINQRYAPHTITKIAPILIALYPEFKTQLLDIKGWLVAALK